MQNEISIIGFGNFGKFISTYLSYVFKIYVYDNNISDFHIDNNIFFTTLEECVKKDIIILAIPVQFIENTLLKIQNIINKNALVIDVCSVKIKPIELMKKYLPETIEIIGTHPLFGPQSAKNGIEGLNIVLSDVRGTKFECVKSFIEKNLKLNVYIKTPEEHDKEMAMVQALTHFVGRGLTRFGVKDSILKTKSFDCLLGVYNILHYETDELFYTIQKENPFAKEIRKKFLNILIDIDKDLDNI